MRRKAVDSSVYIPDKYERNQICDFDFENEYVEIAMFNVSFMTKNKYISVFSDIQLQIGLSPYLYHDTN